MIKSIVLIIVLGIIILILKKFASKRELYPYTPCPLLTKPEQAFFTAIKPIISENDNFIACKVRLEDIVNVDKKQLDHKSIYKYRGYIKSRHVDFAIVSAKDYNVTCVIEIDDKTHRKREAKEIDQRKDKIFEAAGIPIVRIPAKNTYKTEEIKAYF